MKFKMISVAMASAFLAFSGATFAQASGGTPNDDSQSSEGSRPIEAPASSASETPASSGGTSSGDNSSPSGSNDSPQPSEAPAGAGAPPAGMSPD